MDVMCKSPFLKPPAVHFSYTTNNGQVVAQQQVQLPITMNKFLQPKQVTDVSGVVILPNIVQSGYG